jgi:hypothetical protein
MAKVEGTQSIPASIADAYSALLTPKISGAQIRTRCPFDRPKSKAGGVDETDAQKTQRARFIDGITKFADVDIATRARWYGASPIWHSFLWYYNYFIMSDLTGNADIKHGGVGVIKSIQFKTISMPSGSGEGQVAITAVDPAKCVVMLYGSSLAIDDEAGVFWSSIVYPYVSSIAAELVKCKWSIAVPYVNNTKAADIGITVIEYI